MQSSRARKQAGVSMLDGIHLAASYHAHVGVPHEIIVSRSGRENPEIAALLESLPQADVHVVNDGLFRELSSVATPTGILAVVKTPRNHELPADPGTCLLLEDIQDSGNMGSMLRSAAAAGVDEIYLSKQCVNAWSPRVLRAAMGAHFQVRIYEQADLLAIAQRYTGTVVATRSDAERTIFDFDLSGKTALIFGNEGAGISDQLFQAAHATVAIPMAAATESLNVAAAAAICLFERVRQQKKLSKSAA